MPEARATLSNGAPWSVSLYAVAPFPPAVVGVLITASVFTPYVLKDLCADRHDAVALGAGRNSPETIRMMCGWAEKIVVMQPKFKESVPEEFHDKLLVCDVGPDQYGSPLHPTLTGLCGKFVGLKKW